MKITPKNHYQDVIYDLYGTVINVWYGVDPDVFIEEIRLLTEYDLDLGDLSYNNGLSVQLNNDKLGEVTFAVWTRKKEISTLVHELSHSIFHMLKFLKIGIDPDGNNENFCYMLDYAVEALTEKNIKDV